MMHPHIYFVVISPPTHKTTLIGKLFQFNMLQYNIKHYLHTGCKPLC